MRKKPNPNPLTVTLEEAGDALGVHAETIRKRAGKGEIPHHRIGDRWLIPRQWVVDVLDGNAAYWQTNAFGQLARVPSDFRNPGE
jgi:excisionase family DNA binding protein